MISPEIIDEVITRVEASYLGEAVLQDLRKDYPDIRFTYCSIDDITSNAKPVAERSGFNVYFVDAREHCACLTNDNEIACGMVLAETYEEDDD